MRALAIILLVSQATGEVRPRGQFLTWYPQYGFIFETVLDSSCANEYQYYFTGNATNVTIHWDAGADEPSQLVLPVVACLLDNTNDYIKAALPSAEVILGLTPTILAVFSASSEDAALLIVVGKGQLLTVSHIIFGTLIFSSTLFIGPRDALLALVRFIGSALGCRMVLMYELARLREAYKAGLQDEAGMLRHQRCEHNVDCYICDGQRDRGGFPEDLDRNHTDGNMATKTVSQPSAVIQTVGTATSTAGLWL